MLPVHCINLSKSVWINQQSAQFPILQSENDIASWHLQGTQLLEWWEAGFRNLFLNKFLIRLGKSFQIPLHSSGSWILYLSLLKSLFLPTHMHNTSHKFLKPLHFAGKTFLIKLSNRPFVLWLINTFRERQSLQLANGNNQVYSSYIR